MIRPTVLISMVYNKAFEVYQELLEQVASDAFDADASDQAGCVLVTKEALDRSRPQRLDRRIASLAQE